MVLGNRISSIFGLLFALFVMREGYRLDVGGFRQPGPGFFTFLGGMLLGVFSAILLIRSFWGKAEKGVTGVGKEENPRVVVYIVAALILYALLFEALGFILCTFFLVVLLLWLFDRKKWWLIFLTAGLVSAACYTVFNILLGSELPPGVFEFFLD